MAQINTPTTKKTDIQLLDLIPKKKKKEDNLLHVLCRELQSISFFSFLLLVSLNVKRIQHCLGDLLMHHRRGMEPIKIKILPRLLAHTRVVQTDAAALQVRDPHPLHLARLPQACVHLGNVHHSDIDPRRRSRMASLVATPMFMTAPLGSKLLRELDQHGLLALGLRLCHTRHKLRGRRVVDYVRDQAVVLVLEEQEPRCAQGGQTTDAAFEVVDDGLRVGGVVEGPLVTLETNDEEGSGERGGGKVEVVGAGSRTRSAGESQAQGYCSLGH